MRRRLFPNFIGDYAKLEERQAVLERIMQAIGFSPENPYTLTVNDGTYNRVLIGKINGDYGIKIVNNAGATIVFADGHITADGITTGTLDADRIAAGSITVDKLNVIELSAITANAGVITAGTIYAEVINAGQFSDMNSLLPTTSIHGDKIQTGTLKADRIEANTIDVDQIKAHIITTDEIAYRNVDADYILQDNTIKNRVIYADINAEKIVTGTLVAVSMTIKDATSRLKFEDSGGYYQGEIFGYYTGDGHLALMARDYLILASDYDVLVDSDLVMMPGKNIHTNDIYADGGTIISLNNTYFYGNQIWYWNLYYYSDRKIKKDIKARFGNLADILKLEPKEFKYKEDKEGKKHIGLMVEDVEKVLPELIGTDDKGVKGVDITEMIPILIGAVKELKEEVELLKKGGLRGN